MLSKLTFSVIGGDKRYLELIKLLSEEVAFIKILGFNISSSNKIKVYDAFVEDLFNCDVLMLPIPYRKDDMFINFQLSNHSITIQELLEKLQKRTIVFLGKADDRFINQLEIKGNSWCDITEEETFSILNAIPSAEGAIQKAMEKTDITIHGARTLILGYGRIGKSLARMLKGIGAKVTVEARNNSDLAWILENGYMGVHINDLDTVLFDQDIIFNTVPSLIMDSKRIEKLNPRTVIIDLASSPGGVDFDATSKMGIKASHELGLPGKVAPRTAAKIIYQVIKGKLVELQLII